MRVSTSSFCAVTTTASMDWAGAGGEPSAACAIGHVTMRRANPQRHIPKGTERTRRYTLRAYAQYISIMCHERYTPRSCPSTNLGRGRFGFPPGVCGDEPVSGVFARARAVIGNGVLDSIQLCPYAEGADYYRSQNDSDRNGWS